MTEDDYRPADKKRFLTLLADAVPTDGPLETQCLIWAHATYGNGSYGQFWLGDRNIKAHRMAWLVIKGEFPSRLSVLHHCDVKPCVNIDHLFLGTYRDNVADMIAKGRDALIGERNGNVQLTEEQVLQIHDMARKGVYTMLEIADMFGVSKTQVIRIKYKKKWKHLWLPDEPQGDRE